MTDIPDRLATALADRYRIERALGAGGMATVWLAEDLRHERRVALKVLRPELTALVGGERFIQEIRTTASLQHPHILPLFDSGEAGGFLFYVMPYIEGETLRDKLVRETQLGVEEAVRIACEVADALDYAHRHGIVHRDMKPENILLHDGRPVVADFGIALALSAAGGRLTETGTSVGTPHYMSPEQATADREITPRSDIYSLGSVLFEMLTGNPPHPGSSAQQIIMRIVAEDAPPIERLRKSVPPNVAAAVSQALEKLPADRFESAKAFADALQSPAFSRPTQGARSLPGRMDRRQARVTVAAFGIAAIALGAAAWGLRPAPPRPITRYSTSLAPGETRDGVALAVQVAISPDGSTLVFREPAGGENQLYVPASGEGQLFVKRREDLIAQPLAGTEGGTGPFFSPDGRWLGYFVQRQLRKMPIAGGASIGLADSINIVYAGGTWLDDGSIVFHDWPDLRLLPANGGPTRVIVSGAMLGGGKLPWLPRALPDSRGILFAACVTSGPSTCDQSNIYAWDARRDTLRLVIKDALAAWYAPTGYVLYATRGGTLFAVAWDNDALAPVGAPKPLLDGLQAPGLVLSGEGTALYVLGPPLYDPGPASNTDAVWVDRSGRVTPVDQAWRFNTGGGSSVSLSPDGNRLALRLVTGLGADIWIKQLPAGPLSRLTLDPAYDGSPVWTPDGRSITFVSDRLLPGDSVSHGRRSVWEQVVDGDDSPKLLWSGDSLDVPMRAFRSADNGYVMKILSGAAARSGESEATADREPPRPEVVAFRPGSDSVVDILSTDRAEEAPALSPDSRWLAYVSDETGRWEVFVQPYPDVSRGKWQISKGGGTSPVWARDGSEIYYLAGDSLVVVAIHPGRAFSAESPRALFALPASARVNIYGGIYDVAPDNQHFLFLRNITPWDPTGTPRLVVVQNFFDELKAKMSQ